MIKELAGPGSGYATCTVPGHDGRTGRHWGPSGAAGVLCWTTAGAGKVFVLLARRSRYVQQGGTWSVPGGAIEPGETALDAALAELAEEVHVTGTAVTRASVTGQHVTQCPHGCGWQYTTCVARLADGPLPRVAVNRGHSAWETSAVRWVEVDRVPAMRLHPGLAAAWPALSEQIAAAVRA